MSNPGPIEAALAAIRAVLEPLNDDVAIPAQPEDQIGDYPRFVLYPQPDVWTPAAHGGSNRRPVWKGEHDLVVEWHMQNPDGGECVRLTTPMADAIPSAILQGMAANSLEGTVTVLKAIRCQKFGELRWGSDETFGVRLIVEVMIMNELPA